MDFLIQELRHALRSLVRQPSFSLIVILALALGIGANVGVFTVVWSVLLRPLPFPEADRLIAAWEVNDERGWVQGQVAPANFCDWQAQSTSTTLAAYNDWLEEKALMLDGEPRMVRVSEVTGDFFEVLGVRPALGPGFEPGDTWTGGEPRVVLSDRFWRSQLGGDPGVLGRTLELDGTAHRVVGVMPAGFDFPFRDAEVWLPTAWDPASRAQAWFRRAHFVRVIGRLDDGIGVEAAHQELATIAARLERDHPETNTGMKAGLGDLREWIVGERGDRLRILSAAVAFLLPIACANVANMLFARASQRRGEMAVRSALGASRRRLVLHGLAESLLLGWAGGGLGLLFGALAVPWLLELAPHGLPTVGDVRVEPAVVVFALVVASATAALFGLVPAWRSASAPVPTRSGTPERRSSRAATALVAVQIALAVPLVAGSGLMVRTLANLIAVDPGFAPANVLVAKLQLPSPRYADEAAVADFYARLLDEVAGLPGVESVSMSSRLPFGNQRWSSDFTADGWGPDRFGIGVRHDEVAPGLFATLGVPLVRGRDFTAADGLASEPVVIVNQALAERYFPGEDPIGRRVAFDRVAEEGSTWRTIVGVVGDVRRTSLAAGEQPSFYAPVLQDVTSGIHLLVRTEGPPLALLGPVRERLRALDPRLPLFDVTTLESQVAVAVATERFLLALLGVFALLGTALAGIGIFAVVAYTTRRRRRELGIRRALGAEGSSIVGTVVARTSVAVAAGVALGLAAAVVLGRGLGTLLFGIAVADPATLAATAVVFAGVAFLACLLPVRWALRLEPATTLRAE